jgi:hypothetical protein
VPIVVTWLCGWLAYRMVMRERARVDGIGAATAWLLGAGVIHGAHYSAALTFHTVPPPVILFLVALVGLADMVRVMRRTRLDWLGAFRREPLWGGALLVGLAALLALTAAQGFGNDTALIWLGRAKAYAANPDYLAHVHAYPWHPGYPPLFIHQYQWQNVFTDSLLGLKLPPFVFYLASLAVIYRLLSERVSGPMMWTFLIALLPTYWINVPYGMADIPLSAYVVTAVYWLRDGNRRAMWLGAVLLGLATLVKTEGAVLVGCVLAAMLYTSWREPEERKRLLSAVVICAAASAVCAASWYVVTLIGQPHEPDFALSAFDVGRVVSIAANVGFVILDPRTFNGVWLIFAAVLWGKRRELRRDALIWLPPALYVVGMVGIYFFSNFSDGVGAHVRFSYGRLLQQVTPLAMVYVAWALGRGKEKI